MVYGTSSSLTDIWLQMNTIAAIGSMLMVHGIQGIKLCGFVMIPVGGLKISPVGGRRTAGSRLTDIGITLMHQDIW